jgi:hypothetical protein
MKKDFKKLFLQKSSQYFYINENGKKETEIFGDHPEIPGALSPSQVVRILNNNKDEMRKIAIEQGFINTDYADFYVKFEREWDERGDDYDPYNVSHEVYFLKAVMKLT